MWERQDSKCLQAFWLATGNKERGGRLLTLPKQIIGRRPCFRHTKFEMPADILVEMSNGQMKMSWVAWGVFLVRDINSPYRWDLKPQRNKHIIECIYKELQSTPYLEAKKKEQNKQIN